MATTLTGALEPKAYDRSKLDNISGKIGSLTGVDIKQNQYSPDENYINNNQKFMTQFENMSNNKLNDPFKNNQAWNVAKQNTLLATTGQDTAAKSMQAGMDEKQALQKAATLGNQNIQNQAMGLGAGQASALGMQAQRDINSQQAQQQGQLTGQLLNRADNATNQLANLGKTEAIAQTDREKFEQQANTEALAQAAKLNAQQQEVKQFYDKIGLTQEEDRLKAEQWNKEFELGKLKTQADIEKAATELGISVDKMNLLIDKWDYEKRKDKFLTMAANTDFTNPESVAKLAEAYASYTGISNEAAMNNWDTAVSKAWDTAASTAGQNLGNYVVNMNTNWVDENGNSLSSEQVLTTDPTVVEYLNDKLKAESYGDENVPSLKSVIAKINSGEPLTTEENAVYQHAIQELDQTRKSPTQLVTEQTRIDVTNNMKAQGYSDEEISATLKVLDEISKLSVTGGASVSKIPGVDTPVILGADGTPLVLPDGVSDVGVSDDGIKYTKFDDGTVVINDGGNEVKIRKNGGKLEINKDGKWETVSPDDSDYGRYSNVVGITKADELDNSSVTVKSVRENPLSIADKTDFTVEEEQAITNALFNDPTNIDENTRKLISVNPQVRKIYYDVLSDEAVTIGKSSNSGRQKASRRTFTGDTSKGSVIKIGSKYYIINGTPEDKWQNIDSGKGGKEAYQTIAVIDPVTGETKTLNSYNLNVN